MKKLFFLAIMIAALFTSCNKYELSDPINMEDFPKVTVSGKVYAELDNTKLGLETVPHGTIVAISIPYEEFNPNHTGEGYYIDETTVDVNGNFSIEVPVVLSGVSVQFTCQEFTHEVIINQDIKENRHFNRLSSLIVLPGVPSSNAIDRDFTYTEYELVDPYANEIIPTKNVNYSGKLTYLSQITDNYDYVYSNIPSGTKITVKIELYRLNDDNQTYNPNYKYIETKEITIGSNGYYEIRLPMIDKGKAFISMSGMEFFEFTQYDETRIYKYNLNTDDNIYALSYSNKDYTYSKGELIY